MLRDEMFMVGTVAAFIAIAAAIWLFACVPQPQAPTDPRDKTTVVVTVDPALPQWQESMGAHLDAGKDAHR